MINLLPLKEKQELLFQKNRNLVVVLGSEAIIFLVCLALVLLSIKFYILQKISYEKGILQEARERYETRDFLSLLDSVKRYNADLSLIDSFYKKEIHFSNTLKNIISIQKPSTITFNSIDLERTKSSKEIKTKIYGASDTRDNLLFFKSNIEAQENMKNVYLPPDNLVKPTNISFNITFEVITKNP